MKSFALFVTLFLVALPLSAWTMQESCNGSKIMVDAEKRAEIENVCNAVQIGDNFLTSVGLKLSGDLIVTLVKELPKNGSYHSIGYFNSRSSEIYLLSYEAALNASHESVPSFGILMNPPIWGSYVVHELGHFAAQKRFASGISIRTASEYIASVAQLATLPSVEREKIIRNYPELSGFDKPEEITMAFYLLDPSKFTVNAYLHYSKPENGLSFINRLLSEGLSDD